MRYNYYISFNSSDYAEFTPANDVELTTKADEGTFRYRTEVNEIKITKTLDSSTYATLESWFTDSSKFSTEIYIRQQKGSTVKWTGVFGIKQGTLNAENCYYTVTPETEDTYRYINGSINNRVDPVVPGKMCMVINEDDDFSVTENLFSYLFESYVGGIINRISSDSGNTYTVKSSSFWNDTLPSGGSGSGYYNPWLNSLILKFADTNVTCENIFNVLNYFNAFYYVDSNGHIRLEIMKYFQDLISDYSIDLTGETNIIPEFKYEDEDVYKWEIFEASEPVYVSDWDFARIEYTNLLTTFRTTKLTHIQDFNTYLESYDNDSALAVTIPWLLAGFKTVSAAFTTFNYSQSSWIVEVEAVSISDAAYADTNFLSSIGGNYDYYIDITYSSGDDLCYMQARTAAGVNSGSPVQLVDGGVGGSIAIPNGGYLHFYTTNASEFTMSINLTFDDTLRVPWETGTITAASHANARLSWGNVIENHWTYGRYAHSGTMNGTPVNFDSTVYNKKLKEFKIFHEDDIDPLHGVLTDYGIARIESYVRDENDFVTFQLTFQEDE